jgi:hypothetical protein
VDEGYTYGIKGDPAAVREDFAQKKKRKMGSFRNIRIKPYSFPVV